MSTAAQQARQPVGIRTAPTRRDRPTRAAARTAVARKGILATAIADIAAEARRSAASFCNYYDGQPDARRCA